MEKAKKSIFGPEVPFPQIGVSEHTTGSHGCGTATKKGSVHSAVQQRAAIRSEYLYVYRCLKFKKISIEVMMLMADGAQQ